MKYPIFIVSQTKWGSSIFPLSDWKQFDNDFHNTLNEYLLNNIDKVPFKTYRLVITFDNDGVYRSYSKPSTSLDLKSFTYILNNLANDYMNDYKSGVEDYNPDTVIKYNIIVFDGLKTSSSHVDLTTTSGTPTSMLSSIAPITAGKVTLNVNDVLNKYIPNVNESEFPQYRFQTTAGLQYTNVSVYSADNNSLLFSFRDTYVTNPIYFNRIYGLFVFKFERIDKNLKLISKIKNYPNLKSISVSKPDSNLNLDFGVVDL